MTDVNVRENQIRINDLDIHFKTFGKGDTPVVLLHGWGIDSRNIPKLRKLDPSKQELGSSN